MGNRMNQMANFLPAPYAADKHWGESVTPDCLLRAKGVWPAFSMGTQALHYLPLTCIVNPALEEPQNQCLFQIPIREDNHGNLSNYSVTAKRPTKLGGVVFSFFYLISILFILE